MGVADEDAARVVGQTGETFRRNVSTGRLQRD